MSIEFAEVATEAGGSNRVRPSFPKIDRAQRPYMSLTDTKLLGSKCQVRTCRDDADVLVVGIGLCAFHQEQLWAQASERFSETLATLAGWLSDAVREEMGPVIESHRQWEAANPKQPQEAFPSSHTAEEQEPDNKPLVPADAVVEAEPEVVAGGFLVVNSTQVKGRRRV